MSIVNEVSRLSINYINLVNKNDEFIDIKNLVRDIKIRFSLNEVFPTAIMIIHDSWNLINKFPINENCMIEIGISDIEREVELHFPFLINSVLSNNRNDHFNEYKLQLIWYDYMNVLKLKPYRFYSKDNQLSEIFNMIGDYYSLPIVQKDHFTDPVKALFLDSSFEKTWQKIRLFSNKFIISYRNFSDEIVINSFENLIEDHFYVFTPRKIQKHVLVSDIYELANIQEFDLFNDRDFQKDGLMTYQYFNVDFWKSVYELQEIRNPVNDVKFISPILISPIKTNYYFENYIKTDYIEADMYAPFDVEIGEIFYLNDTDESYLKNTDSPFNGFFLLYEIIFHIDIKHQLHRKIKAIRVKK